MDIINYKPHKSYQRYSEAFMRKVCEEYARSDLSANYFSVKYGLKSGYTIKYWLRKFGMERPEGQLPKHPDMPKEPTSEEVLQLKRRIKELERSLEDAQLTTDLYKAMIKIAERELGVSIEKKAITKPSK